MITFVAKLILFIQYQFKKVILFSKIEVIKSKCTIGSKTIIFEEANICNFLNDKSRLCIGEQSRIRGELMVFPNNGKIIVGEWCYIGDSTRIWSAKNIIIGDRVLISHGVNIHDFNSHPSSALRRHEQAVGIFEKGHTGDLADVASSDIIIEDDVWIGFGSTILKGVKIGKGSIIGANSLVTQDIPEYCVVVGNPAQVVKKLSHE